MKQRTKDISESVLGSASIALFCWSLILTPFIKEEYGFVLLIGMFIIPLTLGILNIIIQRL